MNRKFRLLKDIFTFEVEAKAGCIGIEEKEISTDSKVWFDNRRFYFRLSTIMSWKDWFEEVTDTERIEVEFIEHRKNSFDFGVSIGFKRPIPEYKFSAIKEALEKALNPEVVEEKKQSEFVIGVDPIRGNFEWKDDAQTQVIFKSGEKGEWIAMYRKDEPWSQQKFEADMKKAAEYFSTVPLLCEECGEIGKHKPACSANTPKQEKKEQSRDWEIVSFVDDRKTKGDQSFSILLVKDIPVPYSVEDYLKPASNWLIHSVRRLSDNTLWEVGDYVGDKYSTHEFKIEGFHIVGSNHMRVTGVDASVFLSSIKKLPPKPQPLFVTNDNKEIFTGDPYWHIVSDWTPQMENAIEAGRQQYKTRAMQTFSTKEAADEYVLMNKPCLSIKEVADIDSDTTTGKEFEQALLKLVKSKSTNN